MPRRVTKKQIFWVIAGAFIVVVFFTPIFLKDYQAYILEFMENIPYAVPLIVIVFRFIGVVLAPLPGAPVAFASMAFMPWYEALLYNFIGTELGAIAAFLIARRFREPAVKHIAPIETLHQWQDKISSKKQFFGFAGLRVVSLVAFDFVSYAAGLTKLPFWIFISVTLLIDIPAAILFFYFGGLAVSYSIFIFALFVLVFFAGMFFLSRFQKVNNV